MDKIVVEGGARLHGKIAIGGAKNAALPLLAAALLPTGASIFKNVPALADVHIVVDNAKSAADATQKFNSQLDAAKKAGGIPPMVDSLVKSLVVKASGSEIVLTASAPEKDVLTLANMAMAGGGP